MGLKMAIFEKEAKIRLIQFFAEPWQQYHELFQIQLGVHLNTKLNLFSFLVFVWQAPSQSPIMNPRVCSFEHHRNVQEWAFLSCLV